MIFLLERVATIMVFFVCADNHEVRHETPSRVVARRAAAPHPAGMGGVKFKVTWESPGREKLARDVLALNKYCVYLLKHSQWCEVPPQSTTPRSVRGPSPSADGKVPP